MIILDDCLSAVDTETEEEIIKTLRSETEGKTIVVISHRLKAVKDADKIFVFDDGKIVEEGNHDELIVKEGIYYSMYIKQLIEKKKWRIDQTMASIHEDIFLEEKEKK